MAINKGKLWEQKFAADWKKCFPNTFLFRLHDLTSGYRIVSQQPADYLAFDGKTLFMLEIKSHEGSSIPFSAIPQYERLLQYKNLPNVKPYIIIWFKAKGKVIAVPIETAEQIYNEGKKSIGIGLLNSSTYNIIVIPAEIKRTYPSADYSILIK